MDLFDIDIHIFTVIKFLFNLGVRFNNIYTGRERVMEATIYINITYEY